VRRFALGFLLLAVACSSGPTAPAVEPVERVCGDLFCATVPNGWEVEIGERYMAFHHPLAPDQAFATISPINMEAMVVNAGGSWPAGTEDVVRSFWQLLDEAGAGHLEHLERFPGGSFRSEGTHEDGLLWHLLIPGAGSDAVGFEVRGPNRSWEMHADVFFSDVEVLGS
jgi:hypothetical protein